MKKNSYSVSPYMTKNNRYKALHTYEGIKHNNHIVIVVKYYITQINTWEEKKQGIILSIGRNQILIIIII